MQLISKYYLIFCLLAVNNFVASCQNVSSSDRVKGWQTDIDFLLTEIKKQHYVYKNAALPDILIQKAESLKNNISQFSNERLLIELERLMYYCGDGHTYILPFGANIVQTHFLPVHFYEFSDGLFVIDAIQPYEHLIGCKVSQIGPIEAKQFMRDMISFVSQDNTMGAKWIGPFFLRFRGMLESYGLAKGSPDVTLKLKTRKGKFFEEKISFVPVPRLRGIPKLVAPKTDSTGDLPLYIQQIDINYWIKEIPQKKTVYVQFNQVMNAENESLQLFSQRLGNILTEKKPELVIIDVRHNNGGNADLTPPFIDVLKKFEKENALAKIVLITGRNTFSAAQIFIARVNKETKALFAGEPSSSSPNFVGEENMVMLPWSGATGSISNRYHENIPGDNRKWIEPDIKVELSSKEFFANVDPVLEEIFKRLLK